MAFIVPDKLLETLICDSCHKYLSVKPIKVFPNRRIKCGRCCRSKNESDGVVSLYGVVANRCLFKCINRFDGCRKLLTYAQVENHEKVCLSKQYKCPICPESMEIQTFLLGKHFKENHKSSILDNPGVSLKMDIPVESPVIYFYRQVDSLFFLVININLDKKIELGLFYLGDATKAKNINQQFTVSNGNDLEIKMEPISCYTYLTNECDYISVTVPNTTCSVFITFSIIVKDEKLIKLPDGLSLSSTSDLIEDEPSLTISSQIVVPKKTYFPMAKEGRSFLINNDSIFKDKISRITGEKSRWLHAFIFSDTACRFRNCSNCQNICLNYYDGNDYLFYWNTKLNSSICYYCFKFLKSKKEIDQSEHDHITIGNPFFWSIKIICGYCNTNISFNQYWKHTEECKLQSLKVCPDLDCNFQGTLSEIITHMKSHPYDSEIFTCSSFYVNFNSKTYFYFDEGFVSLNVVPNNLDLNLKIQMVPSDIGDRDDFEKLKPVVLIFDVHDSFITSFEDSFTITIEDIYVSIYLVKIILTKV